MSLRLSIVLASLAIIAAVQTVNAHETKQAAAAAAVVQQPSLREIKVVTNIRDFAKNHPGLRLVPLQKQRSNKARNKQVRYTLGGRVSGDRLVAQSADVYAYAAKKDVTIQLTYPESGNGSIVTYVEIVCSQDSDDGNAYIVAGGIGQRFISVVVEANQTENFAYSSQIYGSD